MNDIYELLDKEVRDIELMILDGCTWERYTELLVQRRTLQEFKETIKKYSRAREDDEDSFGED